MLEVLVVLIPVLLACGGYLSSMALHPSQDPWDPQDEFVGGP